MTASECVVCWLCGWDVCMCVSMHTCLHVCLYEGCEPSSLSMAALMSPPVAMRACRLASRLMKPMALSWSSWDWNRTSGVWVCGWGNLIRHLDNWESGFVAQPIDKLNQCCNVAKHKQLYFFACFLWYSSLFRMQKSFALFCFHPDTPVRFERLIHPSYILVDPPICNVYINLN